MLTPEQHAEVRLGMITSSRINTIVYGGYAALNTLANELRKERAGNVTPRPLGVTSGVPALDWGVNNEDFAAAEFWNRHPEYVMTDPKWVNWHNKTETVFYQNCGASPDRALESIGKRPTPLEIKCPYDPDIHKKYRNSMTVPREYLPQVYWQIMVMNAPGSWFISFDPRENAQKYRYFEVYVIRDNTYESMILSKVTKFLETYLAGESFEPQSQNAASLKEMFGAKK